MKTLVKFRKSVMAIIKICILLSTTCMFIFSWQSYYGAALFQNKGNYVVVLSYFVILIVFTALYNGFRIGVFRLHEVLYSFMLAILFTNFVMYLELSLIAREMQRIPPIMLSILLQLGVMSFGVIAANTVYFKLYNARRILAIFANKPADRAIIKKMRQIPGRYSIDKGITTDSSLEKIKREIDKYEAVLTCDFDKGLRNEIIRYCYEKGKRIYLVPTTSEIIINCSYQSQVFDTPVLVCRSRGLSIEQRVLKRLFDILISAIALLVLSPLMLIVAVGIKLCDRGPVLYKQNRITRDGKIFNIYKFRSMVVDAEKDGAKKATSDDARITKIGRWIRPCRIDELPQLFNILKGDMSIVGPRPERIENVHEYTTELPDFNLRHRVKSGLTGYAQIYGKYNTSPQDKLNMDLIYIENYSLLLDFKLLIMTLRILFERERTEGFAEADGNPAAHRNAQAQSGADRPDASRGSCADVEE